MISRLVAALALVVLCGSSSAFAMGPGGGGAFSCSAVNSSGHALFGADNSGLYRRLGNSGNWTRIGSVQGVNSNNIYSIAFGNNPNHVVVGADGGLYYSANFTSATPTWTSIDAVNTRVGSGTRFNVRSLNITAVCFGVDGADTTMMFVAFTEGDSNFVARTTAGISTVPTTVTLTLSAGLPPDNRVPIKIAQDPQATGPSRDILVLYGKDTSGGSNRSLWRTTDLDNAAVSFYQMHGGGNGGPDYPIDFAFYPYQSGQPSRIVVAASAQATSGGFDDGTLWRCKTGTTTWTQTFAWSTSGGEAGLSNLTGAVWVDDSYNEWLMTFKNEVGPSGANPPYCTGTAPLDGGVWKRPCSVADSSDAAPWRRTDGGSNWELGWSSCNRARGPVGGGVAKSMSRMKHVGAVASGYGPYMGTASFPWMYDGSSFVRTHTSNNIGSNYETTLIDNANATVLSTDPSNNLWAGYYDLGLWKYVGNGDWENKNDADWGWDSGSEAYGGNVTSMLWLPTAGHVLVIAAPSSKGDSPTAGYDYKIYRSTSSGAYNSWSAYGSGLPVKGSNGIAAVWLNSLTRDAVSGKLFVIAHTATSTHDDSLYSQALFYSSDDGLNWNTITTNGTNELGKVVVAAHNDTLFTAGWSGLYWRPGSGGSWAELITEHSPYAASTQNTNSKIHRRLWYGFQDIYRNADYGHLLATSFSPTSGYISGPRGVYRSVNRGLNWTQISPSGRLTLRRSAWSDSCVVIHVASGAGFSSPVKNDFSVPGLESAIWDPNANPPAWSFTNDQVSSELGFKQAHSIIQKPLTKQFWYISPGYGVYDQSYLPCNGSGGGGETDGPGGESLGDAPLPALAFSAKADRALVAFTLPPGARGPVLVYDVAGRRVGKVDFAAGAQRAEWTAARSGVYLAVKSQEVVHRGS